MCEFAVGVLGRADMASTLRIAGVRSHGLRSEGKSGVKSDVGLQSSVSFRGRSLSSGVTKVCEKVGKRGDGAARAALMQAAPLPMRSHETKMRYCFLLVPRNFVAGSNVEREFAFSWG